MSLLAAANSTSWEWIRLPFDWVKWETALSIPQFIHTLNTIKISSSLKISYRYRFGSCTGSQLIKQETWRQSQNVCVWVFFFLHCFSQDMKRGRADALNHSNMQRELEVSESVWNPNQWCQSWFRTT